MEDEVLNVLVVFDHPRRDSFCGAVLDSLIEGLAAAGHAAEIADLQAEAAARRSYRFCLFKQHIGRRIEPEARAHIIGVALVPWSTS
jgi:hypothetical protein